MLAVGGVHFPTMQWSSSTESMRKIQSETFKWVSSRMPEEKIKPEIHFAIYFRTDKGRPTLNKTTRRNCNRQVVCMSVSSSAAYIHFHRFDFNTIPESFHFPDCHQFAYWVQYIQLYVAIVFVFFRFACIFRLRQYCTIDKNCFFVLHIWIVVFEFCFVCTNN